VFVNLAAVYELVCYRGLTCKLLRVLLDRNIFRMVMELISIRSFTLTTGLECWVNNVVNSHSALAHSTAECCAPAWCRSAHTRLINPIINDALGNMTRCLRPTPADNLPILVGIQLTELRRKGVTPSLARCAMELGQLHSEFTCPPNGNAQHLKSRDPFVPAAQQLFSSSDDDKNITATLWADHRWNAERSENTSKAPYFYPLPPTFPE